MLKEVIKALKNQANPQKAKLLARFFKTQKGEYGEGDVFLGVTVPQQRQIAKKFQALSLDELKKLLTSQFHEHRLTALLILVKQFSKASEKKKKQIFQLYLKNCRHVNNWDLVDLSAPKIVGAYLLDKPGKRKILYQLARSSNLWKRRIAILATAAFIKHQQFTETLKIAEMFLYDDHDLIHKAAGWLLREIGKIDQKTEEKFLQEHSGKIPRTMLRYSLERFSKQKKSFYMRKK